MYYYLYMIHVAINYKLLIVIRDHVQFTCNGAFLECVPNAATASGSANKVCFVQVIGRVSHP